MEQGEEGFAPKGHQELYDSGDVEGNAETKDMEVGEESCLWTYSLLDFQHKS